ncbi:MAG TPA: iron donor protein CyaY [Buchnera sp. (in: enterobacteria)]|nr:iron donor protein CyaY [Buchnera sp. (in: enterobacteria)]
MKKTKMTNSTYIALVEELLSKLENSLDNCKNSDIDYQYNNEIFTITFKDKNLILINKQSSIQEVWLATEINGYHFQFNPINQSWICKKTKKNFWRVIEKIFLDKCNENIFKEIY